MIQTHSFNLLNQSRQGSPRAIAQLLDRALEPKGITVKVRRDGNLLTIIAEARETPNQESLVGIIRRGIKDLDTDLIDTVRIYGRRIGKPSVDWSDEVILKVALTPQTEVREAKQGQSSADFLTQIQAIANRLIGNVREIRISKRMAHGLGGFALLVMISFVSVTGFHMWQNYSNQARILTKAETLFRETSDTTKATSVTDLTDAIEKLKQSGLLLQGMPSDSSMYQKAQTDLEKTRSQIRELEQRIRTEESASATLTEIDSSAQEAINTFKNSVNIGEWKTANHNLQQAIGQLEAIPQSTFVAAQVKENLVAYHNQCAAITKAIEAENNAMQSIEAVDEAAQQAMDITDSKSEYTLSDLQSAQTAWQRVIKLLKTIPLKSVPAVGIEQRRSIYTENSGKIAAGIKELKQCLTTNSVTEMCGYISLGLTSSSTSRPSTLASDSEPFAPNSF